MKTAGRMMAQHKKCKDTVPPPPQPPPLLRLYLRLWQMFKPVRAHEAVLVLRLRRGDAVTSSLVVSVEAAGA